ncbi:Dcp1-like decapping family protein [Cordyceps javanica]|uniref:Dcp1-like decapping family protein n=1 Tax=Cordyceps javanica TaxID=43265 RepID=A0A545VPI6_9HYPO|nr:Dcp1-like decapping family protein [Cordyceps javanica]TQW03659.1 Dcp1-like decapping family protein [Cordyceps javanica]
MSRPTPRKARGHKRQSSNLIPAVSDYESDAALAAGGAPRQAYAPPPPQRTNTDINLSVLRRYVPSIFSILSIAANAVVYTFDGAAESWVKSGVEGTLFVCTQAPLPGDPASTPRACVFVLNRRGLGNVIVDLARISHIEIAGELVILRVVDGAAAARGEEDGEGGEEERVLGIWMHNDREETRHVNAAMIQQCWGVVRPAGPVVDDDRQEAGPAMQAIGRPLTMNELFGRQAVAPGH